MNRHLRTVIPLLACLLFPGIVAACLWDYDTLKVERLRFPSTLELIAGKFARHSKEFYEWRIKDRLSKLRANPNNLAYLDDLAVAYDKTGQHQQAIDTMLAKEKLKPGLYETQANLATFYMHMGQWETGLQHVEKALLINPDAHFGREKYQKYLAEYVLSRKWGDKLVLPLGEPYDNSTHEVPDSFFKFLCKKVGVERLGENDRKAALKGVLGMMRFANHASPVCNRSQVGLASSCHSAYHVAGHGCPTYRYP